VVDKNQFIHRKAKPAGLLDQAVPDINREIRLARQYPEVAP
jgi:hypothetical protein